MIDKNEPAFPFEGGINNGRSPKGGLTIRAELAARAMQGMLADPNCNAFPEKVARAAIYYADALIAELNKGE